MKRKNKKFWYIGIILLIGIGVSGCHMSISIKENSDVEKEESKEKKESKVATLELNEKQKSILESVGLSTNVEDLDYLQKKAIIAIDEMLSYLEEKYDKSFEYVGYIPAGNLESESLRACAADGEKETDSFDVRRTEEGLEDDYMLVAIRDDYASYVEELLVEKCNLTTIKVFADIYTTELTEIPAEQEEYKNNVSSWKTIFIYIPENERENGSSYLELIEQTLRENNLRYDSRVIFLKENIILELTELNYTDYVFEDYYWDKQKIIVD